MAAASCSSMLSRTVSVARSSQGVPSLRRLSHALAFPSSGGPARCLHSSAVASGSHVSLAPAAAQRTAARFSQLAPRRPQLPVHSSVPFGAARGMATITRTPAEPEDPDVFDAAHTPPSLLLTERAVQQLAKVAEREHTNKLALRVAVEPGGCHGYQYKMELTEEVEEDDFRFSVGDNVHVLVDSTSLRLIKGSTIDYVTELIGSQFAIFDNPQSKGAGCGCGVSWEPNI